MMTDRSPVDSGGPIDQSLSRLAADGADAEQIAHAAVAIWRAVDKALSPVIGLRGSAALYERSLHLAQADYPWLGAAHEIAAEPRHLAVLHAALVQNTPEQAAAAHDFLLQTFVTLLTDLIGASLTRRLLQAAWEPPSSGHAALDTSS
jgi:hypothetical protein